MYLVVMILNFNIGEFDFSLDEDLVSKEYDITAVSKNSQYRGSGTHEYTRSTLVDLISDEDIDLYVENSNELVLRIEHPFFDISMNIVLHRVDIFKEIRTIEHKLLELNDKANEALRYIEQIMTPTESVMLVWSGTSFRVSDPVVESMIKKIIINKAFLQNAAPGKLTSILMVEFEKRNSIDYVCNSLGIKLHLAPFVRHVLISLRDWKVDTLYFNGGGSPISVHTNKEFNNSGSSSWRMKLVKSMSPMTYFSLEEWNPHSISNLDERSIIFDYLAPYGAFYTGMLVQR